MKLGREFCEALKSDTKIKDFPFGLLNEYNVASTGSGKKHSVGLKSGKRCAGKNRTARKKARARAFFSI